MSDNNSGEKKIFSGKEMRDRIETVLAFLNRNLRGREEVINLSLLSAVAAEDIILPVGCIIHFRSSPSRGHQAVRPRTGEQGIQCSPGPCARG